MSNIMSHDFLVRELEKIDLDNGFFDTLSNLNVSDIDNLKALQLFNKIKSNPQHKIFVAALNDGNVIGSITVLIEDKFIHSGGKVAHIEDVVTRKGYEGSGIGSALVCKALEFSRASGCYKVILDCLENIVRFYEKCGFRKYGISMRCDL
jgi:glucosamine-phosphate N-acetyltransferase